MKRIQKNKDEKNIIYFNILFNIEEEKENDNDIDIDFDNKIDDDENSLDIYFFYF